MGLSNSGREHILYLLSQCSLAKEFVDRDLSTPYEDLNSRLKEFNGLVTRDKFEELNVKELEDLAETYWKRLIIQSCNDLLDITKNHRTRGGEFFRIGLQIEKLKEDVKFEKFELTDYK